MRTHLDLFSGIGGFALAANWAGYTTIGFCEIDDYCQRVLRHHFPDVPVWGDVRRLSSADVVAHANWQGQSTESEHGDSRRGELGVDLITAGYPCQPFSLAGKRLGAEDDRHLWPEVRRLLAELRPARFLGENVAGHINMGLDDVLSDLEEIGYASRAVVVPACAVNAPHRRDRVWIMAHAQGAGGWQQLRPDAVQGALHQTERQEGGLWTGSGGEDVADTQGRGGGEPPDEAHAISPEWDAWQASGGGSVRGGARARHLRNGHEAQQRMGVSHDGLSRQLADPRWRGDPMNAFESDWEEGVPRVVATEQDRVHRLKALGNAIVPQVAYQVLMAMEAA
jgi:DNA (cytosine-5)-methyltransferase 1